MINHKVNRCCYIKITMIKVIYVRIIIIKIKILNKNKSNLIISEKIIYKFIYYNKKDGCQYIKKYHTIDDKRH